MLEPGLTATVLLAAADGRIERHRHPIPVGARIERRTMLVASAERGGLYANLTRLVELDEPEPELTRRLEWAKRSPAGEDSELVAILSEDGGARRSRCRAERTTAAQRPPRDHSRPKTARVPTTPDPPPLPAWPYVSSHYVPDPSHHLDR